jgi:hypothetical protein
VRARDLRNAFHAYNHADWYVAEVIQLAAHYGGISQLVEA